jgi:AraC family transcriptional regulator
MVDEVCLSRNWQNAAMSTFISWGNVESPPAHIWGGVEVRLLERHPGPGESCMAITAQDTTVIIRLDQRGGVCEPRLRPDIPTTSERRGAGFFNWIPKEQTIWCYADGVRSVRDLQLRFTPSLMEKTLGRNYALIDIQEPLLMVYDTRVASCAHAVANAFPSHGHENGVYGESLTTALLIALHNAAKGRTYVAPMGGLAPWQLRIVKENLEQNLDAPTSLAGLAGLIDLSQSRLVRGFKASTGFAPYMWVTKARIGKAEALLMDDKLGLSEIALEVGFADQSHFTKAFKRNTGVTPGEWRRKNR